MESICVYCSSADRLQIEYRNAAREMGAAIAARGLQVVYGAGSTGLMGALADGALQAGGRVVGVIPALFNTPKLAHNGLTRLEVVDTIHVRKARMIEISDAFIALPGGYGTLEEFFEVLTWAQIGLHAKPVGLLNTRGYYDALLEQVERARSEGFIYQEHRSLFTSSESPGDLLDSLMEFKSPTGLERWLDRED